MALDLSDLDTFDFNDRPQAAKNKPKTGLDLFDDLDEFEPRKPYSRRGSVEARNKQAEPDILSKRAQRFQLGAQLDAELSPVMGRGEDLIAHQQRVEEAAATVRPDLPAGWNRQEFESFMDAERGGMGVTPGTGRTAEDAMVVGQNPGVVGAKFREGWRTTKAGAAADEYLRTGRITVGTTPGVGDVDYPVYLEGPAAEKYVRELASVTEDTALAEAFDKQVGAGARALTSTLSQPEQLLSIPGGIVGAMVGQPTLGAALGATPSVVKGYYSDLLANLQAGAPHDIASANALAGAGIDFATETLGGRFGASGGVLGAGARSAAEEASAELGRMGSDYAFSLADESFASKLPKTFGEGAERVGEAGIAGGLGAAIMVGAPRLPGKLGEGLAAAREMLARAGGVSDGRPDVAQPKANTAPSIDAPISIAPTSIDTVDTQITTGINTEEAKREGVNPAGVSKEREIPAKGDTLSDAPLYPVQLTPADAGTIIDTRLSSLREASQRNRLDDGTVKTLQREDEELRLTLQEDESRKQQGILQTPERPYLSDNARNLISQKRAEIREKLEQHRAAVGYGNELRDLEARLNKLGESDTEFVALADSLVRGQGAGVTRAAQQIAATTPQNQSQTPPATPVAPPVPEAPVAPQEAATGVPASTPEVTPAPGVQIDAQAAQTPVTSTQVPQVSNTKPKRTKTSTPKPMSDKDALAQAFTELQTRSLNDPEFQKQVTANPSLMRQMATQRASEIVAQSNATKAPEAPVAAAPTQAETPALDVAAGGLTTNKPKFASKDDFYTELYSGVGDKEAAEARKIPDKIVVYDGDADLASIDPDVAAKVQEATQKQGATGARPRAFQYNGKVYFNMEGVRPGQAKSTFLHEALVHLAAKAEPARVSALAGRVVALAKAGDATAKAAADTVSKEYPGLAKAARDGSESAKDLSREELLADFAQRVYDRVKSGQGVSGTIKRLYSDVMSYLRDLYTTVAKKYLGEKFALSITDVDILDAVRYGRTAAGFKGEAAPTRLAEAAQRVKDTTPAMSLASNNSQPGTEVPKKAPLQATEERIAKTVATLFTPKGTASTDAQLMGERAIGTSNELRIAGEVLVRDLMSSLSDQIGSLPKRTQMLYRYNIGQYLAGDPTAAPNIPKDVRTTLDAMREMLDNNTMRLIALGAVESKDIPKMLNNLGRWIHRDFDVFHHEPGDIVSPGGYQQMVQEMAKRGNDLVAKVLPEAMDEMRLPAADVITKIGAITQNKGGKDAWRQESSKMLREVQGKKPLKKGTKKKNAAIRKQAENYLRAMAGKWGIGKNTPLDGPDGIIERLAALSTKGEDVLKEAAARYANSLLDPNASPYNEVFQRPTTSPMGIDDSALDKARTRVPEWVRVLWGEFKDPVPRFLVSLDNQADIIAKFTALAEYKQKGLASGRVVPNTKDTIDYEMRRKGYHLLQKQNDKLYYGPLENTWVKLEDLPMLEVGALKDFVGRQIRHSMGAGLLKILSVPGQVAKMMLVAGDMSSQMVQAASAVVFYSRLKLAALPKALKGARYTSLGGTFLGKAIDDKQLDSDVKALIQQGVLVNNALAGDARRKLIELVKKPGEEFLSVPVSVGKTVGRGFSAFQDGLSRMMALPDEVSKIMMVYGRMEDLADIYPNKSRDELLALAGEETMQTTPTLNREAPLARFLANSGVINPFATFLASNFRNFYNHFSLAKKYGSMPGKEAKMYAAKELSVASLKAAGIFAITKGLVAAGYATGAGAQVMFASLMQALGADDEEQEEIKKQAEAAANMQREHYPAMRVLVPEWQLGEVQMLREIAPDIYTYGALQRFDPSPMGAIMSAVSRDDPEELAAILSDNLFSEAPLIKGFAAVLGTVNDALADSASRAIPDYQADARRAADVKTFWEGAGEIALNFTPGTIKRVYKQLTDDVDYTALETFITNTGGTVGVLDVRKRTGEIAGDYKAFVDGRKKSLGKIVSTKDGLAFDSEIDLVDDLTERAVAWRKARSKIAAVQSLGKSDLWIKDAIKSNPYASSLSKEEIISLLDGRFVVPNYNKWLKEQRETDLKDPKNSMRKEEVRAQYARYEQDLSKFYEGLQELLQKEGITKR